MTYTPIYFDKWERRPSQFPNWNPTDPSGLRELIRNYIIGETIPMQWVVKEAMEGGYTKKEARIAIFRLINEGVLNVTETWELSRNDY